MIGANIKNTPVLKDVTDKLVTFKSNHIKSYSYHVALDLSGIKAFSFEYLNSLVLSSAM